MPRPVKQDLVLVDQHALVIKRDALGPEQVELALNIRPRGRLRPLVVPARLDPAGSALRRLARDVLLVASSPALSRKRGLFNHLAVVAVDVAGAGDAAMAGDARRKDVVAQGVADGAGRGAQGAGEAAVGGDAAGGNLLEEMKDAFLKRCEDGGFFGGEGEGGRRTRRRRSGDGGGGAGGVGGRVHGDAGGHGGCNLAEK